MSSGSADANEEETLYEAMSDSTAPITQNPNHRHDQQHHHHRPFVKKEEIVNSNNRKTSMSNLDDDTNGRLDLEYMRNLSRSNSLIALSGRRSSESLLDRDTTNGGLNLKYMRNLSRSSSSLIALAGRRRSSGSLLDKDTSNGGLNLEYMRNLSRSSGSLIALAGRGGNSGSLLGTNTTNGGLDLEYMRNLSRSNSLIALAGRGGNSGSLLDRDTTNGGLNLEYMRNFSRSSSLIALAGRGRSSGPLFDVGSQTPPKRAASMADLHSIKMTVDATLDDNYEAMKNAPGFTPPRSARKSITMLPSKEFDPVYTNKSIVGSLDDKEPIYTEVQIYEGSLSIPEAVSKHRRSCSLGGSNRRKTSRQNPNLGTKINKKRLSLPPVKPPRKGSLKSKSFDNDTNGSIFTTTNLSKASSTASMIGLESFETDYIVCGSSPNGKQQQEQQSTPKKPVRTSTENLYKVPRKSPYNNVRSNSTPLAASTSALAVAKKQTKKTLSVPADKISIIIQNFENHSFESDDGSLVFNDNNNRTETALSTKIPIIDQQGENINFRGCTDEELYQRMDGTWIEESVISLFKDRCKEYSKG